MKPKDGASYLIESIASMMSWPLISGSSPLLRLSWMDLEILSVAIEFQQCDFFTLKQNDHPQARNIISARVTKISAKSSSLLLPLLLSRSSASAKSERRC